MKSSRSLPAVKISGWPWIRITRTLPSSCAAAMASAICWYIATVSAFFFSGRAISIVQMPSTVVVRMVIRSPVS